MDKLSDVVPMRILVVEDDAETCENLRDILELQQHHVALSPSFTSALAIDDLKLFDVIILDRKLPDGMVEERLPRFREMAPDTDLIVVTGYADTRASIAALREGVTDYLIKPIDPKALLQSLQHIGRRREVERALNREHQFAEMVLNTAEAIILVLNTQGLIERFNPYLAELTGFSLEEVQDKDWFENFIPKRDREMIRKVFSRTIQDIGSRRVLNPILTRTGEEKEIRWSNSVIRNEAGEITGILSVGLDVTDLILAQRRAQQSDRLATIGQTMTGMAHESRNALQRIQNSVELLEDELGNGHEAMRYVNKIARASNDLRDLLEEVRAYAAPIRLELEDLSLQAIWRGAWSNLDHKLGNAALIESSEGAELPVVNADARRIEQVFRNLFDNAIEACGPDLEVTVCYAVVDGDVVVRVRDNGPGMSPEVRSRIFDAFFTTKPTGTGLGMAIVHRIIEAHDGTICVTDVEDGTEFEIRLPAERARPVQATS